PQCPLEDQPGIEQLSLTPELFADGADPSGSDACAIINPERGFFRFVSMRSLSASTLESAADDGLSLVYGQILLPEFREAPLDAAVLAEIDEAFELVAAHGMKVVPRFHYSNAMNEPD